MKWPWAPKWGRSKRRAAQCIPPRSLRSKRNRYNELLRDRYAGIEPLFDLARLEAKGDSASFWHDGRRYECLATAFTDDGGHLNATGQINIATELMAFLAALPAAE